MSVGHQHKYDWIKEQGQHCNEYFQSAFICSCLSIFLGGFFMILLYRAIYFIWEYLRKYLGIRRTVKAPGLYMNWKRHFQDWVLMMLSAQTCVGRVLVILVFVFSIGSLIIYFINCYSAIQFCLSFQDKTINIDLFFNIFFLFYFGLRFLAASDKLKFWVELNSIVDFFTITPVCVSFYLQKNWLGLRFLRALRLLELPKILQFLQILKSGCYEVTQMLDSVVPENDKSQLIPFMKAFNNTFNADTFLELFLLVSPFLLQFLLILPAGFIGPFILASILPFCSAKLEVFILQHHTFLFEEEMSF